MFFHFSSPERTFGAEDGNFCRIVEYKGGSGRFDGGPVCVLGHNHYTPANSSGYHDHGNDYAYGVCFEDCRYAGDHY